MSSPFLGQLLLVPFNFAPQGWALCQGQILPISQNTALFSLLGTQYGGNGTSTFALPNLQGRMPIGAGEDSSGNVYSEGQTGGEQNYTLLVTQLPAHTHVHQGTSAAATTNSPSATTFAPSGGGKGRSLPYYVPSPVSPATWVALNAAAVQTAGSSTPHSNQMPSLGLNWIIALQGVYPSRQ